MQDFERGFWTGTSFLPWGTTLAGAVRDGAGSPARLRRIPLRLRCPEAFGFGTLAVDVAAPAPERPVLIAAYLLAAPGDGGSEHWADRIEATLGDPAYRASVDVRDHPDPSSAVRSYATWTLDGVSVALSVYGAARRTRAGRAAGLLFLSWSHERAALPYLPDWRAANERLASAAETADVLGTFRLDAEQAPKFGDGGEPAGSTLVEREARLALECPFTLATPEPIASRLSSHEFALWQSPARLRCLSTRWDSLAWRTGSRLTLASADPASAIGAGWFLLGTRNWCVRDHARSRGLTDAVALLDRTGGVRVKRAGDHAA
ncbi:hypothetical protein ACUN0C_01305 [Faunimonas sp. B44]|uniref:hypothetical protein n=1 Tax=Faunimonas sp. B44 TaxID=3461493 RepID=UPI004043FC7C